jgi:tellurite resistance protein TerC
VESKGEAMLWFWIVFHAGVLLALTLDLYFFRKISPIKACIFWLAMGLSFNILIGWKQGGETALAFFTAYLLELSLSIDNLFVFLAIFTFFAIRKEEAHRVLFWGILGALVFRLSFIVLGLHLIEKNQWIYFVFGSILCLSAVMVCRSKKEKNLQDSFLYKAIAKTMRITNSPHKGRFWVLIKGKLHMTSLFVSLIFVEFSDIIFAVDSIPAVLAITSDPFIAYTSNVFAILGLRSLYGVLGNMQKKYPALQLALACVLFFIGIKMLLHFTVKIPVGISLGVIVLVLVSFLGIFPLLAGARKK